MKPFKAVFCIAIILSASVITARAQQSTSANGEAPVPRAVLPFYSYHFGDVNRGEVLIFIFTIKNIGNADLQVKDFTPDCGCEVVSADKIIAPGKEGKARVQIDTTNLFGNIFKNPILRTNDPDQPKIQLTLTANVLAGPGGAPIEGAVIRQGKHIGPIFLSPGDHASVMTIAGQKAKAAFEISAERGPVKVLRVESDNPIVAARVETVEEGKKYKVVVEPAQTATPGSYEAGLQVFTDSAMLASFTVGVRLKVVAKR